MLGGQLGSLLGTMKAREMFMSPYNSRYFTTPEAKSREEKGERVQGGEERRRIRGREDTDRSMEGEAGG